MLRMGEENIFKAFLKAMPDFAGRPFVWAPGADPPDFLCTDSAGKRIGVELAEWLEESQIKASIERERLEESYLKAIRSEQVDLPENIGNIWISPKPDLRLQITDASQFQQELYTLICAIDSSWFQLEDSKSRQGLSVEDFSQYPTLKKYLQSLRFFSRSFFNPVRGIPWIRFPSPGGAYSPQWAVDALVAIIKKKSGKYAGIQKKESLDELYLIVYYDQALFHNTPFLAPAIDFSAVVKMITPIVEKDHGVFQKVFLFYSMKYEEDAILVWAER